ncbi:hypothetical protein CU100_26535, partial [Phyllobacterium endophyticum]
MIPLNADPLRVRPTLDASSGSEKCAAKPQANVKRGSLVPPVGLQSGLFRTYAPAWSDLSLITR